MAKKRRLTETEELPLRRSGRLNVASTNHDFKRPENKKGLATLPDELYLEVMSHFPVPPEEPVGARNDGLNADLRAVHRDLLTVLSQTCHNLRRFCKPNLWRRIELLQDMRIGGTFHTRYTPSSQKRMATELFRQLEIVTIRNPSYAQNVNIINVDLYCSPPSVNIQSLLEELARCMVVLINIHTVKLNLRTRPRSGLDVSKAIELYTYSQIRSVIIPTSFVALLKHCPGLRSFQFLSDSRPKACSFLQSMQGCSMLESFPMIHVGDIHDLPHPLIHLRELEISLGFHDETVNTHDCFRPLLRLTSLQKLTVRYKSNLKPLEWAQEVLLELQKEDHQTKYLYAVQIYRSDPSPRDTITLTTLKPPKDKKLA